MSRQKGIDRRRGLNPRLGNETGPEPLEHPHDAEHLLRSRTWHLANIGNIPYGEVDLPLGKRSLASDSVRFNRKIQIVHKRLYALHVGFGVSDLRSIQIFTKLNEMIELL